MMVTKRSNVQVQKDLSDARSKLIDIEMAIARFSENPQEFAFELSKSRKDWETYKALINSLEKELAG